MMNHRPVALMLSTLSLAACASLRVQVSVLDPEVVREMAINDRLAESMPSIVAETDTSIKQYFAEREDIHGMLYDGARKAYTTEATKFPTSSDDYKQLMAAAGSSKMPAEERADYDYWLMRMLAATSTLQRLWPKYRATATTTSEHLQLRNEMLGALDEREAIRRAVDRALIKDFSLESVKERFPKLPADVQASLAKAIQDVEVRGSTAAAQQPTQLFNSGEIQISPYAYYVAKADKKSWATHFDQTVGRGTFGNTDVAIKALAPGNFTIKGVSFNPADVAAAAAKVTSQTVLLAAQVAGVPVKLSGAPPQGAAGGALAQSSQGLSSALAQNAQIDQRLAGQREALRSIAAAIVNERTTIRTGAPAQRKASLAAIKAVYDSRAPQLRVSDGK